MADFTLYKEPRGFLLEFEAKTVEATQFIQTSLVLNNWQRMPGGFVIFASDLTQIKAEIEAAGLKISGFEYDK